MAGRKKGGSRPRSRTGALAGTAPEDITQRQYDRAWNLYRTGMNPRQICEIVELTRRQLAWLHGVGNAAKGQIPFERRLVEEREAIRSHSLEAGMEMSERGVRVLRRAMLNAESAAMLVSAIFRKSIDKIQDNEELPEGEDTKVALDTLLPRGPALEAIKALRPYCDMAGVVHAYKLLYEQPPGERVGNPAANIPAARMDLGGEASLPAAYALMDEHQAATGGNSAMVDAVMREMAGWSVEQMEHYAKTGEEPTPEEVIDAQAKDEEGT